MSDLAVTSEIDFDDPVVDASAVRPICEILSPSHPATDRVLKAHHHAGAGIPWYPLADPRTGALELHFALRGQVRRAPPPHRARPSN